TRLQGDWSSDVCSSDLRPILVVKGFAFRSPSTRVGFTVKISTTDVDAPRNICNCTKASPILENGMMAWLAMSTNITNPDEVNRRSEERREGKEGRIGVS